MENQHSVDLVYPDAPLLPEPLPPEPTPEQLARAAALRRFNRRVLYLPLAIITLLWVVTFLAMLWLALISSWFPVDIDQQYYRDLFSGIADVVLIGLFGLWLLMGAIPIALAAYLWWQRREWRRNRPPGLPLMWRIENVVVMISERIATFLPMLARPVALGYSIAAYISALFSEIKKMILRRS